MGTSTSETAPTVKELEAWARDPTREKWRNLISSLTDLFLSNLEVNAGENGDVYGEIVCRLLDDVATEVRKELSERVAPIDHFPGQVVRRLASDEAAEVATPMLEHSPVLTEDDLIDIVDKMLPDHTRAISRRKSLGENLTDALVKRGDVEAVRTMTANPGARLSQKTFRIVAERAKTDIELQESLVSREDLTHVITCQITPFLSEELKARLRALDEPPEGGSLLDSLSEIASESERKAEERKKRAAVYSLIEKVRAGHANANDETIKLVNHGDDTALIHFLAGIAQLPDETIETALSNPDGFPLAVALRGLGLGNEAAVAVGRLRGKHLNLSEDEIERWIEDYGKINLREAEKSLQILRKKDAESPAAAPAKDKGKPRQTRGR